MNTIDLLRQKALQIKGEIASKANSAFRIGNMFQELVEYLYNITFKTAKFLEEYEIGNSGAAKEINWLNGNNQKITLTDDCTVTMLPIPNGVSRLQLKVIQGLSVHEAGGNNIVFPDNVIFPAGSFDFTSATQGQICIVTLYYDGTHYVAMPLPYYTFNQE